VDQEVAKTLGELELKLQELERELTSIGRRDTQPSPLHAPGKLIDEAVERDGEDRTDVEGDEDERAVDNAVGGPAVFGGEELPAQGGTIARDSAFPVSETAYGEIATGSPGLPSSFPSGVFSPATSYTPQPGPPLPPPITPPPPTGPPPPPPGQAPQPPLTPPEPPSGPTPQPPPSIPPGPPSPVTPPGPPDVPAGSPPQPSPNPQPIDRSELARFKDRMQRTLEDLIDECSRLLSPKPPT